MKRREFIRLGGFLTVSAAAIGLTGCDPLGDNDNTSTSALEPNLYPDPVRPVPAAADSSDTNWSFPQSVASGDPKSDSIILWTRVLNNAAPADPTVAMTADVAITLQVSADSDNSALLGSNTALTDAGVANVTVSAYADFDGTVRHKLTALDDDSVYYYQFIVGGVRSKVGRFKTAPAATSDRTVKFAFMSCQDWSANHWGAFSHIVSQYGSTPDGLDFVVHLGDYIYETDNAGFTGAEAGHGVITFPTGAELPPERTTGALLPADPPGKYATTTADYRHLYKLYRSDSRIQAMHERFAMVAVWDDHEFSDDAWMNVETYTNKNNAQFERRRSANQAWFEFMPADVTFQEANPSFQNIQLYRDLKFGTVMHLVMTDERLYKQDHLIPENTPNPSAPSGSGIELGRINSRYLAPESTMKLVEGLKNAASPNMTLLSILGAPQRDWWKSTMLNSTSTWKVWGNEVSLLRMSLNGKNAIATLLALGFVTPLATGIGTAAGSFGGDMSMASAYVGATTFGALAETAGPAVAAIHAQLANGSTAMVGAGIGAGLTMTQAQVAVTAYLGSYTTAGGAAAQAATGAQAIAIGSSASAAYFSAGDTSPSIRNEIRANGALSPFYSQALGGDTATMARVSAFLRKFVLNADQWDGYRMERTNLMNHLIDNGIENVVAVTGDIHAFFAGSVYNEYAGEVLTTDALGAEVTASTAGGTAAMVDLVTAGVSSTSWFSYLKAAADGLDPTNSLIGKLVYVPVPIALPVGALYTSPPYPANSPAVNFTAYLNMLDFTMGKVLAGATDAERATNLAAQLNQQIKTALAAAGVFEAALETSALAIQGNVAISGSFASAVGLAKMLSALGQATNPWLSGSGGHVDTEAQGYAVVEASTTAMNCYFHKLNPIVGAAAPTASRIVDSTSTKLATIAAGSATVTVSTYIPPV
ncbi:MAG: alkaline phosphatase D family protein [Pseudomonadota bacterium]